MATADELLAGVSTVDRTLVIDNSFRTIKIPATVPVLGVATDDDVLRLDFRMPRYVSNTDLSAHSIRVNYINANGDSDAYTVKDAVIGSQYITFTWLVGPIATQYKGDTKFNVSLTKLTSDNLYIDSKFNTAPATLPVLEGLEVDESIVIQYSDIIEQWRQELFGIGDTEEAKIKSVSEAEQTAIVNKGAEVLATIPADYQTAVSMTDNADRTKADAIVCSTQGEAISVFDSSDDYLRGLKIFGKTTQVNTTGKNLLNIAENITLSNVLGIDVAFEAGTYIVSITSEKHSGDQQPYIRFYNNNVWIQLKDGLAQSAVLSQPENMVYLYTYGMSASESVGVTATFNQLMVSRTGGSYEPYSGGVPSPSPEWAQELVGITNPKGVIYGGNFANANALTIGSNQSIDVSDDGYTIKVTGGADKPYTSSPMELPMDMLRGRTVILKADSITNSEDSSGKGGNVQLNIRDSVKMKYVAISSNNLTAITTIPEDVTRLDLNIYTNNSDTLFDSANTTTVKGLRLLFVDLPWETYMEPQSIVMAKVLSGIPVTSGGNYTDVDGQQWICDEIDFERGVYIQRCKTETLTFEPDTNDYGTRYVCYGVSVTPHQLCTVCMCPQLAYSSNVGLAVPYVDNGIRITPTYRGGTVVARWDDTVIESLTVTYLRETPLEIPLTAEEIQWFRFAHTNFPNTTVFNDAGAMMELTYNADTKTWLENLPKATDDQVYTAVDAWLTEHFPNGDEVSY